MTSQPLKWHGGKHYLAKRIVSLFPPHTHYVEPYFGGGAVLFAKPREWVEGHSEVVNDIDGDLMAFWRTLAQPEAFAVFARRCEATPFSQDLWEEARRRLKRHARKGNLNEVQRAFWFFVRYRQSRQGLGDDFATLSRTRTRRGMNEQASAWLSAVEGLPEAHGRLRRVVILCDDALKVIEREDGPKTHFYCDPPYLQETRTAKQCYQYEMTLKQHLALLNLLAGIEGTFQLSGYHCEPYDDLADDFHWRCVEFPIDCKASGAKNKPRRVECLWTNYEVPSDAD